jgi:hypothetical protein
MVSFPSNRGPGTRYLYTVSFTLYRHHAHAEDQEDQKVREITREVREDATVALPGL